MRFSFFGGVGVMRGYAMILSGRGRGEMAIAEGGSDSMFFSSF